MRLKLKLVVIHSRPQQFSHPLSVFIGATHLQGSLSFRRCTTLPATNNSNGESQKQFRGSESGSADIRLVSMGLALSAEVLAGLGRWLRGDGSLILTRSPVREAVS